MFCLDFAFSFAFHLMLSHVAPASFKFGNPSPDPSSTKADAAAASTSDAAVAATAGGAAPSAAASLVPRIWSPYAFVSGGAAGLLSACVLFPVDVVRQSAVPKGVSSFAWSSGPFTAVYIGAYFTLCPDRENASLGNRVGCATIATAAACAVELPLDRACVGAIKETREEMRRDESERGSERGGREKRDESERGRIPTVYYVCTICLVVYSGILKYTVA